MKKAAIIGLGDISAIHIACLALLADVQLVAVCDADPAARERAPKDVPFFTDYREMVRVAQPDCVHICLPHDQHYPVAREAAAMGCHVFCEKPLAVSLKEAQAFAALEDEYPALRFGICLQNRFNQTTLRLKEIIAGGEYGAVVGAKGLVPWARPKAYYDVKPWRGTFKEAGSGTLMNQSIHTLDLLYALCGPIKSLRASASQLLDYGIEVEDTVSAALTFANGAKGVFWATNANFDNESTQITVALEKAVFHIEDGQLRRRDGDGGSTVICEDERMPGAKFYYGASHLRLMKGFYMALENGVGAYIPASDGVMSIRLIMAILAAGQSGQTVEIL